ncbi:MAG: S8 family serine peptidase [Vicinamibacterales bacterium]
MPQFQNIDWAAKGRRIKSSLESVRRAITASRDPLSSRHYYLLAKPVELIHKKSKNLRLAPDGVLSTQVRFAEEDSRVFRRLGMDLVDVTPRGDAIVHIEPERINQLVATSERLGAVGAREQARWASLDNFAVVPSDLRIDEGWLRSLKAHQPTEAVVEFQPLLSRVDIETLLGAISGFLNSSLREGIVGMGTDFSGRFWAKGKIAPESLRALANAFYSIQTLHSPLVSSVAAKTPLRAAGATAAVRTPVDLGALPSVAVLDTGVPSDHSILKRYRRGTWISPDSYGEAVGSHGSMVASRIVFGDVTGGDTVPRDPAPTCLYYDALVATSNREIDDKSVVPAVQAIVGTAPDVRVFNLSFDTSPLDLLDPTKRRENLLLVQDLDNMIFRSDILVVVSAGNTPVGLVPSVPYPNHYEDPNWQLGAWARSFNSLTCGSHVAHLAAGGLVTSLGWPSPFTRLGPGLSESPKPDFSDSGGNASPSMQFVPGLGVYGLTASGLWEDHSGTSYAAPLLARECAFALQALQRVCLPGARPYAVAAKAFLALSAQAHQVDGAARHLASRALGRGRASAATLGTPSPDRAVLIWQGLLESPGEIARITIPVPKEWYDEAGSPCLRLVVSWDPPVNAAVSGRWATRRVSAQLKASPDTPALHGTRTGHPSYPLIDRAYDLRKLPKGVVVSGDMWLLELSYDQTADYHLGMVFTPQQRVGCAIELYDAEESLTSPQSYLQALPTASTMTRLSISPQPITAPVLVRPLG